jgi:hypothetical protein
MNVTCSTHLNFSDLKNILLYGQKFEAEARLNKS